MGAAILPGALAHKLLGLNRTDQSSVNAYAKPLSCHICKPTCSSSNPLWWLPAETPDEAVEQLKFSLGFPTDTTRDDLALRASLSYLSALAPAPQSLLSSGPEIEITKQGVSAEPPTYVTAALHPGESLTLRDGESVPHRVVIMRSRPVEQSSS